MTGRRLICEQDVLAMPTGEVLHLDPGAIITPAALDSAHARGIRVLRAEEGVSARGAQKNKKDCLWHRVLENDGTYVVQVVNGQATVSRLTQAGPVPFGKDSVQEHNR